MGIVVFPRMLINPATRGLIVLAVQVLLWPAAGVGQDSALPGPIIPGNEQASAPPSAAYWFASSRECCQRGRMSCPQGSLRYFAADANSQLLPLDESAFLASLDYSVPICVVIHGDRTSFEDIQRTAPTIANWIRSGTAGQPLQIVFYTWPSDDENMPLPAVAITARGERAEFNGCYLAELISRFPAGSQVSFFGHSFGARVAVAALHLLGGGRLPGCRFRCPTPVPRRHRAVLVAAAMDRNWVNPGDRYGQALLSTERLLNIHNEADLVSNLYPIRTFYGIQALGRVGFSPRDRLRMGVLAARVSEWDATWIIRSSHSLAAYYQRPEIAAVMGPVLAYGEIGSPGTAPVPLGSARSAAPLMRSQPAPSQAANAGRRSSVVRDSRRYDLFSASRSGL